MGSGFLASASLRSYGSSLGREHISAAAECVGNVFLASDSRRSCGYSLGREHISAFGMTLKIGVETLWCYAGHYLAASEGGAKWMGGVLLASDSPRSRDDIEDGVGGVG